MVDSEIGVPTHGASMTAASARFLLSVVNSLRPDPGAPDFPEAAAAIIQAQAELKAIVAEDVTEPVE